MAKMIIEGIYVVNDDTEDLFFDLWDEKDADPEKIETLIKGNNTQFVRLDNPKAPYCHDPINKPNEELQLHAHPGDIANTSKMISLAVDVSRENGEFTEDFKEWVLGQSACAIIVYKKSCCPEWSVMLCGDFGDGFDYVIKDSARTHEHEKQYYANSVTHDGQGSAIEHDYNHVKNGDRRCDHDHSKRLKYIPAGSRS